MATIDIKRDHSIGKDQARQVAEKIAERLKDKIQVTYRWDGDSLRFERSGAKGSIDVTDKNVRVAIELGMMLRPMKGMVEEKVNKYLDDALSRD